MQVPATQILVLAVGNALLSDEGAGLAALRALEEPLATATGVRLLDGGTLSFTLAPAIAACDGLIVLDAALLGETPGSVHCFEGSAMDRFLGESRQSSVHEVGLADLMTIARLTDGWPARRALIGIEPQTLDWGERLSPAVAAGIGEMCSHARRLIAAWEACPDTP